MKTKILILFLPMLTLLAMGCKEEQCEAYAPAGAGVSWTGYNPMEDVLDYFYCHVKTVENHIGDTLKIAGYFLRPAGQPEKPFVYEEGWSGGFFGANPNETFNRQQNIIVEGDPAFMSAFRDYQYGQMIYLTVVIKERAHPGGCCSAILCTVIEIGETDKE